MTLAAILAVCLLSTAYPSTPTGTSSISSTRQSQAGGSSQAPPAQPSPTPTPADQPKPAQKPHHRKKISTSNCSTAAPAPNFPQDSASPAPCPPPKKVVRHGGSDEPAVQLTGGATSEQTLRQRSTEQLRLATEENLKQIEGRQLSAGQQEMKNQINQFMEQSKTAAVAGDLDRAHNLAMKAHLLSEELLKP
jgi:hypothetical protein